MHHRLDVVEALARAAAARERTVPHLLIRAYRSEEGIGFVSRQAKVRKQGRLHSRRALSFVEANQYQTLFGDYG